MEATGFQIIYNVSYSFLTALFLPTGFDQGCGGKWVVKQKLEHTVIVFEEHVQREHCAQ